MKRKELSGHLLLQEVFENPAITQLKTSSHILLLQGPVGPFFDRLTTWLQKANASVYRVALQGGDEGDCKILKPIAYQGTLCGWPEFLENLIRELNIDCLVLFGQSRSYHEIARKIAGQIHLPVIVCEEGYFRPGFVTMELGGVNGYSSTLERFIWKNNGVEIKAEIVSWHFQWMALHAARHYLAMKKARARFPGYEHHRSAKLIEYVGYWLQSWCKKLLIRSCDFRFQKKLFASTQPYFFVPLQHGADAQIIHHSPFEQNTDFIIKVMRSFAMNADKNVWLVFRQHPHSRGGKGHSKLIFELASALNLNGRVFHLVEGDTPDLAEKAMGVVVINSTVGLQAIERKSPLIVLGEALYKKSGIVYEKGLDSFWKEGRTPKEAVTKRFLKQIKQLTQAPASVYAKSTKSIDW